MCEEEKRSPKDESFNFNREAQQLIETLGSFVSYSRERDLEEREIIEAVKRMLSEPEPDVIWLRVIKALSPGDMSNQAKKFSYFHDQHPRLYSGVVSVALQNLNRSR